MKTNLQNGPVLMLAGRSNRPLAKEIGDLLNEPTDGATIRDFADDEIFVRIDRNARGRDVYIIQSTSAPAENTMELLLLIDAAKRASADRASSSFARHVPSPIPRAASTARADRPGSPWPCRSARFRRR